MGDRDGQMADRGKWLALTAALLGWMFDGLEMGLFPLVGRPALRDLLGATSEAQVGLWYAVATAGFLVGAATGGVVFGWLGDRIGRVRAMTLSVFTYALFSGLCGICTAAWQVSALRFLSALGMGGEWALGVALVMEIWPDRSRAFLAGMIGAAGNVGYLLIALFGLTLNDDMLGGVKNGLLATGLSADTASFLTGHSGWRLLMLLGATPALLTFLIRLFVPESRRWEESHSKGATSHWATQDLLGVLIGAAAAIGIIYLWAEEYPAAVRLPGSLALLVVVTLGYLYPVFRYLQRSLAADAVLPSPLGGEGGKNAWPMRKVVGRMLLGAGLGGVALLATWASIQWGPTWADKLTDGKMPHAKAYTQIASAIGAILGTIGAAYLGDWIGRRPAYCLLCLASLGSTLLFFQGNTSFGPVFLATALLAGALTASFYGWLPLYLPELFPTRVRATGQGFSYNFGRVLAAVGVLQTGNLMGLFTHDVTFAGHTFAGGYPLACSTMSFIYLVGVGLIWLAPETRGQPLPE